MWPAFLIGILLDQRGGVCGNEPKIVSAPVEVGIAQPVALATGDSGKTLFVANHRGGSLSVIDTEARKVVAEHEVGRGLADLAIAPDGRHLLAVDQAANELLLLDTRDRSIRVVDRIKVSPDPVRLAVSADGSFCIVASPLVAPADVRRAGQRASSDAQLPRCRSSARLDLPFCPRELALVSDGSQADRRRCLRRPAGRSRYDAASHRLGAISAGAQYPRAWPSRPTARRWWSLIRCSIAWLRPALTTSTGGC